MSNWTKLRFAAQANARFSHPSEKFSDSEVWKEKRYEICFTHNKTAHLYGFKNISKYGYKVWQESGFYVEGENELMVKSALLRYAAGGFHLSREKRETIQQAVKQGWLFSDIEQELNLDEERRKSSLIRPKSITPVNFEPETVLHDAETSITPDLIQPVKKIRIVEEIPEYNIPMQMNNDKDKRFTLVMIIWGSIALLLAIVTIISVVITHSPGIMKSKNDTTNLLTRPLTTTPAPVYNSNDCNQASTRCSRCDYISNNGFLQRKCLECAGNYFLNAKATTRLEMFENNNFGELFTIFKHFSSFAN